MVWVALLRGINVGGNRKVDMKRLKVVFESLGFDGVRTYINSGNVIFTSKSQRKDALQSMLEGAILAEFGFAVPVVLRDRDRMRALADTLPRTWANDEHNKCDVMFLAGDVDGPDVLKMLPAHDSEHEDVMYAEGAVLWRVDRSYASRSALLRIVGTDLYARMTVRNCNTVRKLADLMG